MVPAVIMFRDSTVDPENNNQISTVLKSNFAPYDRDYFGGQPTCFSNVSDTISEANGVLQRIQSKNSQQFHQGALQVGSSEDSHNWPSSNGMFTVEKKDEYHVHRGSACFEEYNNVAKDFNVKLQGPSPS
ncbi:hypothetical protein V6N12_054407 [Hibiscus sabdariffa]|uniref:Uncharacterized protein n=1 Tax=Hibiscus sabdariffa TaxID=183260 RepID=A0ABR2D0C5_9ROSI